jgi:hypothetical protein
MPSRPDLRHVLQVGKSKWKEMHWVLLSTPDIPGSIDVGNRGMAYNRVTQTHCFRQLIAEEETTRVALSSDPSDAETRETGTVVSNSHGSVLCVRMVGMDLLATHACCCRQGIVSFSWRRLFEGYPYHSPPTPEFLGLYHSLLIYQDQETGNTRPLACSQARLLVPPRQVKSNHGTEH